MSDFNTDMPLSARAMAARPAPYLDGLNPAQRQAVEVLDGPVLMLAGAGTGKTKALTARIAHLLNTGRAWPSGILAVTFTNKAAREMKLRVGGYLGEAVEGMPWLGTFHSISAKLLRRHAELVGLQSNFTILDTDDQLRLLKQLINAAHIDEKRWPARLMASIIDQWKNRAWTPEQVPSSEASAFNNRGTEIYAAYQERLKTLNACDFGDLLLHCVTIFQAHPDVLESYQKKFRYILVDEYQDTNVAQYLWLRLLASAHKNICCVGDDDQSIYGWRGAEVGNILRFERDFPGATVVRLEQNYRSTPHILAAASQVIAANEGRLGKTLWTEAKDGEKLRLIGHWDGEEEARWIGEQIEDHVAGRSAAAKRRQNTRSTTPQQERERLSKGGTVSSNPQGDIHQQNLRRAESLTEQGMGNHPLPTTYSLDEIAILVRASHQMRAFEDRFLTIGLPYRVIGGPRFYERMEIRDAMAYFRLAVSPGDDLAFERIVNTPRRGLGDKAQQVIQRFARANGVPLVQGAALAIEAGEIKGRGAGQLRALIEGIARWHAALGNTGPMAEDDLIETLAPAPAQSHVELAETILEESGYTEMWMNDKTPEAPGRLENLKELIKALEEFDNLQGFLEHIALIMDNDSDGAEAKVTIMTLHAAKGLEFPVVFLPGWEDGLFPSQRSMDESGLKGLEEERRLAYVGITRAEELCTISFAANRRVYGQWQSQMPSRFVDELPAAHVEVLTPPGLYGGGMAHAASTGEAGTIEYRATRADVYNSPGWRRLQASGSRPVSQPHEARAMVIDATAAPGFAVGERVFHQKFGYGSVVSVDGDKLFIEFEKSGARHVVAKFIVPAAQADEVPF